MQRAEWCAGVSAARQMERSGRASRVCGQCVLRVVFSLNKGRFLKDPEVTHSLNNGGYILQQDPEETEKSKLKLHFYRKNPEKNEKKQMGPQSRNFDELSSQVS